MRRKIRWYNNLYLAPSVRAFRHTIRYEMKYRKVPIGYFFIALPEADGDLFDIWGSEQIKLPWRKKEQIDIVGVAGSLSEAKELAAAIICEVYKETGGFDVRAYLGYK